MAVARRRCFKCVAYDGLRCAGIPFAIEVTMNYCREYSMTPKEWTHMCKRV